MADDDDTRSVVYIQSSGVDTPQRAATPFFLAATAAAMEWDVKIYFTINGPTLLKKGVAENLYVKKDGKNGGGMPASSCSAASPASTSTTSTTRSSSTA